MLNAVFLKIDNKLINPALIIQLYYKDGELVVDLVGNYEAREKMSKDKADKIIKKLTSPVIINTNQCWS